MAHTATAATQTRDQPLASRVTWENGGNREIDSLVADEVAATAASALAATLLALAALLSALLAARAALRCFVSRAAFRA